MQFGGIGNSVGRHICPRGNLGNCFAGIGINKFIHVFKLAGRVMRYPRKIYVDYQWRHIKVSHMGPLSRDSDGYQYSLHCIPMMELL